MNDRIGAFVVRDMRRFLPGLAATGLAGYMLVSQFVLRIPVLNSLAILMVGVVALAVFLRPLWGYYMLIAAFSVHPAAGTGHHAKQRLGGALFPACNAHSHGHRPVSL